MKLRVAAPACVAAVLIVGSVIAADFKSGPQPGDQLDPFEPLNVTGPFAGQKACLI